MKQTYLPRPDKAAIRVLPRFEGLGLDRIKLLRTASDVEQAEAALESTAILGLDTESKPTFLPNQPRSGPHLIQLATEQFAILCPATFAPGLAMIGKFVASDAVVKTGFGLRSDHGPLQRLLGVKLRRSQELSGLVQRLGYAQKMGLQMSVAVVLGQYLQKSKKLTTSDWSAPRLTSGQILYAANDAYASLQVYLALHHRQIQPE